MYGKAAIAPCGHAGETIIGTYVKCLKGCDHVKKETPPGYQDGQIKLSRLNKAPSRGYYDVYTTQPVVNGTFPVSVNKAPKETPCRVCKQPVPFLRMSNVTATKAIYQCPTCKSVGRVRAAIRTVLQGPYDGPP